MATLAPTSASSGNSTEFIVAVTVITASSIFVFAVILVCCRRIRYLASASGRTAAKVAAREAKRKKMAKEDHHEAKNPEGAEGKKKGAATDEEDDGDDGSNHEGDGDADEIGALDDRLLKGSDRKTAVTAMSELLSEREEDVDEAGAQEAELGYLQRRRTERDQEATLAKVRDAKTKSIVIPPAVQRTCCRSCFVSVPARVVPVPADYVPPRPWSLDGEGSRIQEGGMGVALDIHSHSMPLLASPHPQKAQTGPAIPTIDPTTLPSLPFFAGRYKDSAFRPLSGLFSAKATSGDGSDVATLSTVRPAALLHRVPEQRNRWSMVVPTEFEKKLPLSTAATT